MRKILSSVFLGASLMMTPQLASACGTPDDACDVATGFYHVELPKVADGPVPAVLFLHGYGGSGAGVLKMRGMVEDLKARGYAVIAPTAERRGGTGKRSWVFYPGWEGRDENQFLQAVVQDAALKHDIDADRVILSGFSAGGFMVNYLACDDPGAFPAYAPVSGGFWNPMPESCKGPIRMLHTHGWTDGVVPLEGRILGGGRFEQGDIFAGLEIWRRANACQGHKPEQMRNSGDFLRRVWQSACAPGSYLELALFPGGHKVPKGWADMVVDWFETHGLSRQDG
ncbi:MAG: prolyl oligopeptidase family serine peptidase [Rhodobacteraceae bacterium]|nr:prolyl oligopeptidase family serine peptidase [Paracoccaceae bacterium]